MSARDNQLRAQHARTIDKQRLRRSGAGEVGGVTVSDPISLDKQGRITFTKEAFLDLLRSMVADPLLVQPGSPEAIRLKLDASMDVVKGKLAARPSIEDIKNQNDESLATARLRGLMSPTDKAKLDAISGTNTGDQIDISGNAGSATQLQTPRTINDIPFDGTADITIPTGLGGGVIVDSTRPIAPDEKMLYLKNTGGSITVSLDTDGGSLSDREVVVVVVAWNALNTITIDDRDGKNINGAATKMVIGLYTSYRFRYSSDQDEWYITT